MKVTEESDVPRNCGHLRQLPSHSIYLMTDKVVNNGSPTSQSLQETLKRYS